MPDTPTTVWNRSAVKAGPLVVRGASAAGSAEAAVSASPLIVACLFDHASVHEVLGSDAGSLRGRSLVNLTTSTPNQAPELAQSVHQMMRRQIAAGHRKEGFARIFEELRSTL